MYISSVFRIRFIWYGSGSSDPFRGKRLRIRPKIEKNTNFFLQKLDYFTLKRIRILFFHETDPRIRLRIKMKRIRNTLRLLLKGLFTDFTWGFTEPSLAKEYGLFLLFLMFRSLGTLWSILWCSRSVQSRRCCYWWTILNRFVTP